MFKWSIVFRYTENIPVNANIIIGLIQYFEADFLWKVSLKMLNADFQSNVVHMIFSKEQFKITSANCCSKIADQFNQSDSPTCPFSQDSAKT